MKAIDIQDNIAVNYMDMPNSQVVENINYFDDTKDKLEVKNKKSLVVVLSKCIKSLVDFSAGLVGTFLLIPLTIIVYIANKITGDDGPIFYTQERIGKDGIPFKMIKYRTMVLGADEKLKGYLANNEEARKEYKKYKKLKNDPRITKFGKFLRKTSLDEMPQILHLLTFKMSLIGPRPYLLREKEEMGKYYDVIIKCTPRAKSDYGR